jgi:hypothetical protein
MVRYIQPKDRPTEVIIGSATNFTVTQNLTVNKVLVEINGVTQIPTTDYTISGTTLTFGTAPAASDAIVIRELPI